LVAIKLIANMPEFVTNHEDQKIAIGVRGKLQAFVDHKY